MITYTHAHTHTHTHIQTRTHTRIHTLSHRPIYIYSYTHTHTHTHQTHSHRHKLSQTRTTLSPSVSYTHTLATLTETRPQGWWGLWVGQWQGGVGRGRQGSGELGVEVERGGADCVQTRTFMVEWPPPHNKDSSCVAMWEVLTRHHTQMHIRHTHEYMMMTRRLYDHVC